MNWKNLFKPSEILTASDRAELEKLDESTKQLRELAHRIEREWPGRSGRYDRLRDVASRLADNPGDRDLYRQLEVAASMPPDIDQLRDLALREISGRIEAKLEPSVEIVRRVLGRALDAAEAELKKTEKQERKLAEEEGYAFSPSGRVLALQARVLELRNAVAAKYGNEGAIQSPPGWRERLREWL